MNADKFGAGGNAAEQRERDAQAICERRGAHSRCLGRRVSIFMSDLPSIFIQSIAHSTFRNPTLYRLEEWTVREREMDLALFNPFPEYIETVGLLSGHGHFDQRLEGEYLLSDCRTAST
jgi:hypothetical protein